MTTYDCNLCNKIFSRQIDLDRHMKRKIPCNRKLICPRCFKVFGHKTQYNTHINRKILCEDKRSEKDLLTTTRN